MNNPDLEPSSLQSSFIDLHIHSTYSDGLFTVREIVETASNKGLKAISITDHDTFAGQDEAKQLAKEFQIKYLSGVEISTGYQNYDVHILGYNINYNDPLCQEYQKRFNQIRLQRAVKILDLLSKDGIVLDLEKIKSKVPDNNIVRPHIAEELVDKGYCRDNREAFYNFIGNHCKYYVAKGEFSPQDAIEMIHKTGGFAVLAHPFYLRNNQQALSDLISMGLDGLEVYHPLNSESDIANLLKISKEQNLVLTGGSDCHGGRKNGEVFLGNFLVDYSHFKQIQNKILTLSKEPIENSYC